ncbi:XRE family transcriptional regulator [Staphylococcus saprophyticus]|uniref:helix-turn-helix domain-containing protein n=1 Tax=Staphylococcus saprophyticus TaxID=29385 RepID=UPI0010119087|nr:helix-turn-helix transcriptional regulator [Staphylococcus saprophyticus]MDW4036089.1 helix-turn-helix transcriptional regulator [Staphylococcus saprophyticus]MDW4221589.1 helix-turn-helix transcriptional regulator [Staphylococcus saprophyticus]MDW4322515.1 helix-turn-helix transcriptional regulator [Staphylococcus saprophyticus]MEB8335787.1 helix-turn-helix domain-containing protein [Staphylococcus saprophyticus]RXS10115.1 XRE family transcriptional regulator [Staphylococcus saprophyticus]
MTFGENLKRIRKDMKLTQQEMADRMQISRTYLSDVENGHKYFSMVGLIVIANKLNVSVNKLINDDIEVKHDKWNKKTIK